MRDSNTASISTRNLAWISDNVPMRVEHQQQIVDAMAEIESLRNDLLTAHLIVAEDAYDAPGRISSAIRPFLAGVVERHSIATDENGRKDTP